MNSRESIFEKINTALTDNPASDLPLPEYDSAMLISKTKLNNDDLWQSFGHNFRAASGIALDAIKPLIDQLTKQGCTLGYCDPELMDSVGNALIEAGFTVETEYDRERYDSYSFGITCAAGAIAESGSVILNDETTSNRLAALSPWVHIAVLDPTKLIATIPEAIETFSDSPNIVWATGPSKTADVEGILIEGVHGPGTQILLKL